MIPWATFEMHKKGDSPFFMDNNLHGSLIYDWSRKGVSLGRHYSIDRVKNFLYCSSEKAVNVIAPWALDQSPKYLTAKRIDLRFNLIRNEYNNTLAETLHLFEERYPRMKPSYSREVGCFGSKNQELQLLLRNRDEWGTEVIWILRDDQAIHFWTELIIFGWSCLEEVVTDYHFELCKFIFGDTAFFDKL